jgi:hypothetical protein
MKKLNDYIVEQEINEGLFDKLKNLFKAGGKAMKTNIKNKFADKYPNWYKEYEALEKVSDVEEAKKKIEALLVAIDKMSELKDDDAKAAVKLKVLGTTRDHAEEAKNTDLVKWIDSKIEEINEANPKAMEQVEAETKGEGGEDGGETINPGAEAAGQNPNELKNIMGALNLKNDVFPRVIAKMKTMFTNESLSLFEGKMTANEYYEFAKKLYKDDKSKQEMNIALTTLFLAYEKLKECASNGGGKMVPDAVRALLTQFDKAKEAPADEIKNDVKTAAEQK